MTGRENLYCRQVGYLLKKWMRMMGVVYNLYTEFSFFLWSPRKVALWNNNSLGSSIW